MLIVTPTEGGPGQPSGQPSRGYIPTRTEVCSTSNLEIGWAYAKQIEIVGDDPLE
jgi:hypothetical protein